MRHGDPWGWVETSAEDVTYFDPDLPGRLDGLDALRTMYGEFAGKVHYQGSEFVNPKVQMYGDAAILTYNYVSTQQGDDGAVQNRTYWNTTEVYARIGGAWRIVHTHWSYVRSRPVASAPAVDSVQLKDLEGRG